ncbi:DNA adenine methylase [Mariniluteicoccus endophyticus]
MIKYLGSKRVLAPVLGDLVDRAGATTALDLFTGTTRVAQEFCRRGAFVYANDLASYSEAFARTYVELDADAVDTAEIADAIARLEALPDHRGYVTRTFCERSRYFQPHNGVRIDAIRAGIEDWYAGTWLHPVLLTSLVEAADRVDSTVGLQMAYLKHWSRRSYGRLSLRVPELVPGTGRAIRHDALVAAGSVEVDLAYLDPPYNQHRYFTNYHVWETLVRGDEPNHYGVACKRADAQEAALKSPWNSRVRMAQVFADTLATLRARTVVVSFSDEGFLPLDYLLEICGERGPVEVHAFEGRRYIGARLGVHGPDGTKVGEVSHLKNTEYVVVCGEAVERSAGDPAAIMEAESA